MRLFQNVYFWNSHLEFGGKTGLCLVFPKASSKTNRVLELAQILNYTSGGYSHDKNRLGSDGHHAHSGGG
jgi:hypothetical protein